MLDIYRGTNYARDIESARLSGVEEGRKALAAELGVAYKAPEPPAETEPKAKADPDTKDERAAYFKKRERTVFNT